MELRRWQPDISRCGPPLVAGLAAALVIGLVHLALPTYIPELDYRISDKMHQLRGPLRQDRRLIHVNVDDSSVGGAQGIHRDGRRGRPRFPSRRGQQNLSHGSHDDGTHPLDILRVKGKKHGILVFEVVSRKGQLPELKKQVLGIYSEAFRALELDKADGPSALYLQRAQEFMNTPPPPD